MMVSSTGYSLAYHAAESRAKAAFRAKLEEGLPIKYGESQKAVGLDAMPPKVIQWQTEIFEHELAVNEYELSYSQMCRAFFGANEEYIASWTEDGIDPFEKIL